MTWDEVRRLALALPGVEESFSYNRAPAFKTGGRPITCQPADHALRDDGRVLVLFDVELAERDALVEAEPDAFFFNDHFRDYPAVLVRLPAVSPERIRPYIERSWRKRAPKRLLRSQAGR